MRRRDFLKTAGLTLGATALARGAKAATDAGRPARPNVLWISTEDISPDLGCYGDDYATTPNLDAFAAEGTRYDACFAHMGVCAPARSGIITGMYPTSIGTNHMRCKGVPQPGVRCFTEYLRAAGYYCSNHSKTDYQFDSPQTAWDAQGGRTYWRGRAEGQSFFTVINITSTHESQIRNMGRRKTLPQTLGEDKHDPAKAVIPPYHPDTPVVREDWAQLYDIITEMDRGIPAILEQLAEDGLAEDTIVWFWGDHGRGLPRGKRWIYDSGLRAPLLIRVPEKWRKHTRPDDPAATGPGTVSKELVSFIDFGPTVLSLCGVPVPTHMQGQAVLGPQRTTPRQYIHGARDRVDEANDMIRCVRDVRYKYIRNFLPHLPRSLDVGYMNQMPTMKEMRRLFAEGKLRGPELQYFETPKSIEELYDTVVDPHEVVNLAGRKEHGAVLRRMRAELFRWMADVGDFGVLPEPEFDALKRPDDKYAVTATAGVAPSANGRSVEITCTTPGASIAYRTAEAGDTAETDGIVLHGVQAKLHGPQPWPTKDRTNLQAWRNTKAWVSWEVDAPKVGKTAVHVIWGCGGKENSKYVVDIGGQTLEGHAGNTGDWDTFKVAKLGEIDIPKPGRITVTLKPGMKEGVFQMDLQAVVLGATTVQPLSGNPSVSAWRLYSGPVPVVPGQSVVAKACRLGFKDSAAVRYCQGDAAVSAEQTGVPPHWRALVDESGIVDRVLAMKKLDGGGPAALSAYEKALDDPDGSVRWWGAVGIHEGHERNPVRLRTRDEATAYLDRFRALLKDPSACVRVAAAHALCDWGESDQALPVIVDVLESHALSSGKHFAANTLYLLGEGARPVLDRIRAAKAGSYARRTLANIREQLQ